jgi:hypothetical protein
MSGEAKQGAQEAQREFVYLQCMKIKGKLRVRILTHGYINDLNVQFPRAIRVEGMIYRVKRESVTMRRSGGRQRKPFYSIPKTEITCIDQSDAEHKQTLAFLARERASAQEEKKASMLANVKVFDVNEEDDECPICMDAKKDTVFIPCGHYTTCGSCASRLNTCPICRARVEERVLRSEIGE